MLVRPNNWNLLGLFLLIHVGITIGEPPSIDTINNMTYAVSPNLSIPGYIRCFTRGSEPLDLQWYREDEPQKTKFGESWLRFQLYNHSLIRNALYLEMHSRRPLVAHLSCVARNAEGSERRDVFVKLITKKSDPEIYDLLPKISFDSKRGHGVAVEIGSPFSVICNVVSSIPVRIRWMMKRPSLNSYEILELSQSERHEIIERYKADANLFSSNLTIRKSVEDDSGTYICEAQSVIGYAFSHPFRVHVRERRVAARIFYPAQNSTQKVHFGENVVLKCHGLGIPKPKTHWFKDRKQLTDERFESLAIYNFTATNSAVYECMSWNQYGTASVFTNIQLLAVPMAPVLTVSDTGAKYITLSWTSEGPFAPEFFELVVKNVSKSLRPGEKLFTLDKHSRSFTVQGLVPFEEYKIYMYAVNDHGKSKSSIPRVIRTNPSVPSCVIKSLRGDSPKEDEVVLTWNDCEHQEGRNFHYIIYYDETSKPGKFSDWKRIYHNQSTVAIIKNLESGKNYFFRVSSANEKGFGAISDPITLMIKQKALDYGIHLRIKETKNDYMLLEWTMRSGSAESNVCFIHINSTDKHGFRNIVHTMKNNEINITDISNRNLSEVWVTCVLDGVESKPSNVIQISGEELKVPEIAPFDVAVSPVNTTTAKVSWDFPVNDPKVNGILRGFTIFFTDENVSLYQVKRQLVPASQRSWFLEQLKPGGRYRIQVAANTIKGDGPKSKGTSVQIPLNISVPLPPSNLSVNVFQSRFVLTWDQIVEASLPVLHYNLVIRSADSNEVSFNDTISGSSRNFSFENARDGSQYIITMRAKNVFGYSNESSLTFFMNAGDNTAVRSVKLKPLSPTVVELSWFPPAKKLREELYKLTWQAAKCSFQRCTVYEHNTSRSSYTISDLEPGKNYTVQIFAYFKDILRFGKPFSTTITMPEKTPPPPIIDCINRYNATNMRIRIKKVDYPNIKSYILYYVDRFAIGNENFTTWPRFESPQSSNALDFVEIEIPMLKGTSIYTLVLTSKARIGGVVVEGTPSVPYLVDIPRASLMPLKYNSDISVPWNLTVVSSNIQSTSVQIQFYFKNKADAISADHLEIHYSGHQSYVDSLGYYQQYDDAGINNVTLKHPSIDAMYTWTLSGLVPNMLYLINVSAVAYQGNEKLYSYPVSVEVHTEFDVPPYIEIPYFLSADLHSRTMNVGLKRPSSKNGPIDKYYVVLQLFDFITPYDLDSSFSFRDNLNQHQKIIGVFEPNQLPSVFAVGSDNNFTENYNGKLHTYLNSKLNLSSQYRVKLCVQVTGRSKQVMSDCSDYSKVLSLNMNPRQYAQSLTEISYTVIWAICVILIIIVITIVLIVAVFQHRRGKKSAFVKPQPHYEGKIVPNSPCMTDYQDVPLLTSQSALVSDDVRKVPYFTSGCLSHPPILITEFANVVERLKANDNFKFSQEYESIDPGRQFSWDSSLMDCNRSKNRYANVIAYEHSRVVLDYIDGVPGSDYINANFIDGYLKPLAYIATQGPLPNTVSDFWRMVWQVNCSTIVMMTKLEERNRLKCDQYWPSKGCEIYDQLQVVLVDFTEFATFCVRTFRLGRINGSERHEIKHFQFTAWPDHGVPDHSTAFLMFVHRVKSSSVHDAGPIVVHCSAGVGRTGCFIVVDAVLDRIKHENTVDIYGYVTQTRSQRNYMVQTEDQYIFIYDTIAEAISYGPNDTEVPLRSLYSHLQKLLSTTGNNELTEMEQEFKRLATVKASPSKFFSANLPANRFKNRLVNILPFESTRVVLSIIRDSEGSDYINASYIDSYVRKKAYIATQSPLIDTVSDFWRMIWECNCSIVVMLTKLKELGREKCCQYWPSQGSVNHDSLKVENIAEYNMQQYNLREFRLTDLKDGKYRTVRQFHYNDWPEQGVPQAADSFLELIVQVHKTKDQFGLEHGPIVIHCSAGVGRTGVFITLSIVLERIRYDAVVDIFMTVKMLRTQRPAMVQTEDQYQFCYRAALEYINSFDQCVD